MNSILYVGLDVHTTNYTICTYEPEFDRISRQVQVEPDYKLIKKYNIQLVPTVIMLDSGGKLCQRIEGAVSKDEYETYIQGCK